MRTTINSRILFNLLAILAMFGTFLTPVRPASAQSAATAHPDFWSYLRSHPVNLAATNKLSAAAMSFEVIASGLNNPRGLSFGMDGALYVTEAGLGGSDPCITGGEGTICYGPTGSITRVMNGEQVRFVTGLPSLADPASGGFAAVGPTDVSPRLGGLDVVVGLGADPAARADLGSAGNGFGRTVRVLNSGIWAFNADVSAHESAANPDGGAVDSNPYSLTLVQNGLRAVADAGGNDLVAVFVNGRTETLAVFPDRMVDAPPFLGLPPGAKMPMQAVPNTVTKGPDGALYIGQLTGFPFPVGGANVYRLAPGSSDPEVFASGFTNIIDITFDQDGNLYVLEITANGLLSDDLTGALIKVAPDGAQEVLAMDGLVAPSGLTIGADGAIYISNFGIFPGAGEVIRLDDAAPSGPLPMLPDSPDGLDALTRTLLPLVRQ